MGTPGHMNHPFDVNWVNTGEDLIKFFNDVADILQIKPSSIKWDGINVSFKLVTDEDGKKSFRMDRGTSSSESVIGMTAADAYKKWPEGHGMPPAIETLLSIFNKALPRIKSELEALGMWDDSTKFFNTEYLGEGGSNVIQYGKNILAIHGINQFYEKKAQAHRIKKGIGMNRPGLKRPVDPETEKPIEAKSIELNYNRKALNTLIAKVQPIAEEYGFFILGDVATENAEPIDFQHTLDKPLSIHMTEDSVQTFSLREWLQDAINPRSKRIVTKEGKKIGALSKQVYVAVLNDVPLLEWLETKEDVEWAINGAVFYDATRKLGNDVKKSLKVSNEVHNMLGWEEKMGDIVNHEGIVLRDPSFGEKPVKITGEFILEGMASTHGDHQQTLAKQAVSEPKEGEYGKRIIAIYPGRYQPMGRHHVEVYQKLLNDPKFDDVFIATSNKAPDANSPFDFSEKQAIAKAHGIDPAKVIMTKNPYYAREVTDNYDPETTSVVYLVGAKDMRENPRFARTEGTTKEGFDWKIEVAPHVEIDIPDFGEMSGTTIRKVLKNADVETFKKIMKFDDLEIYDMIKHKLSKQPLEEDAQYHLGVFLGLINESLQEVYSDKQRRWACAQAGENRSSFKGKLSLTKAEADELCNAEELEEELEEITGAGAVAGYAGPVGQAKKRKPPEVAVNEALNYLLQISGEN